jgi:hypothetical protein
MAWKTFLPFPFTPKTLVKELIYMGIAVDTSTWIAVPVPSSSEISTLLKTSNLEACLPKTTDTVMRYNLV